ncbi:photosynthetic complex assembly protein PuhC [Amorphus orientalis]|uniref:Photosynthetic complex assembly protein n=1 Tax=Amorphus orientalis TaxID=649198 RepID=A0AAE3VPN5_9HYPH|nr:photosynthetic complex assembly protein PuhC [Amorphus orientalis]MDQ0315456.1 putative photosynthetic complex assembly protein [Amorphus orientalis]
MSAPRPDAPLFPRGPLIAAGVLIAVSVAVIGSSRLTGVGRTEMPATQVMASIDLRFEDRSDGAVQVTAADDGRVVQVYPPGTNGFVRGVMRGLARERRLSGIGAAPPFRLILNTDGRLTLEDTATSRDIALDAFGPTNAQAFASILTNGSTTR